MISNFPETNIESARKKALNIKSLVADGMNPNQKKQELKKEITFKALFDFDHTQGYKHRSIGKVQAIDIDGKHSFADVVSFNDEQEILRFDISIQFGQLINQRSIKIFEIIL